MASLGGSIFTHNVDQYDYCFRESIECLLDLCDEVVVLDAQSTDGTLDALREIASKNPHKLKLIEGAEWECGYRHERLAHLANQAKSYLSTPWHFMLQADEVVHEKSFPAIRRCIERNPSGHPWNTFAVRRYNLFGDFNHMVSLHSAHKPCNDAPIRLGLLGRPAVGDAESIQGDRCSFHHLHEIEIFHYGLVRKSEALLDKSIDMQTWFHGSIDSVDYRVKEMKAEGTFDPFRLIARSEIVPHGQTHPKYMQKWIQDRQGEKEKYMR